MSQVVPRVVHTITLSTFYDASAKMFVTECDSLVYVDEDEEHVLTFAATSGQRAQALALRALADAIDEPSHAVNA